MNVIIEYSNITGHYYVRLGARGELLKLENGSDYTTRKDDAERAARKAGATSITHKTRSTTDDLRKNLGMSSESARTMSKEFYS